jgi:hypothetical protein
MNTLTQLTASPRRAGLVAGALLLFSLVAVGLLYWLDLPQLYNFTYFGASVFIAGWLYAARSPWYYGFVMWSWFLASFVRRVVDYQLGTYTPPGLSLSLLTPFAVTLLAVLDIPRYGRLLVQRSFLPFLLCLSAVLYGYLIALSLQGPVNATVALLNWLPPLIIGFHLFVRQHAYRRHRHVAQRVFTWGMLLLGLYGIAQFFLAPPWDVFWMVHSEMNSIGRPEAMQIRVFGTLDSPGPYAIVMLTGVILLLVSFSPTSLLAAVPGYTSFLLSMVRGAWLGWIVALGVLIVRLTGRLRTRLIVFAAVIAVLVVPIFMMSGTLGEMAGSRLATLTNIQQDGSYQARTNLYQETLLVALMSPVGHGLGSRNVDSGVVTVLWQLGWPGTALYSLGLFLMFKQAFRGRGRFAVAATAVAVSLLFQMLASNQLAQISGIIFWSMLSLAAAAHYHDRAQPPPEEAPDPASRPTSLSSVPA